MSAFRAEADNATQECGCRLRPLIALSGRTDVTLERCRLVSGVKHKSFEERFDRLMSVNAARSKTKDPMLGGGSMHG